MQQPGASQKRSGHIVPAEYEEEEYLAQLDPIVAQLQQDVPDAKYDRKSLAQLIMQLRKFMEEVMGKNGAMKAFPKLPAKLFQDFRPDGPLTVIASKLHQLRKARDIKRIEFGNIGMRRQVLDMLNHVRKELERLKFLQPPVVHVHESVGDQSAKLKAIVTKMGGQLADSPDDAAVTHVVYPFGPKGDPDEGLEYLRVLAFKGDTALVHWWYLPDSYDERLPKDSGHKLDLDKTIKGPWKVYVRWLIDSEKFNEWMNPIDYETEEAVEEQEAAAKADGTWRAPEEDNAGGGGGDGLMAIPTVAQVMARAAAVPKPAFALPVIPKQGAPQDAAAKPTQQPDAAAAAAPAQEAGGVKSPAGPAAGAASAAAPAASAPSTAGQAASQVAAAAAPAEATRTAPAQPATGASAPAPSTAPVGQPPASTAAPTAPVATAPALPVATPGATAAPAAPGAPPVPTAAAAAASVPTPAAAPHRPHHPVVAPTVAAAARMTRTGLGAAFGGSTKRQRADHELIEVEPGPGTRVNPMAVRHVSVEVHRTVLDGSATLENLSQGQQLATLGAIQGQPPRAPFPTTDPAAPPAPGVPQPATEYVSQLRTSLHESDPNRHYVPYYSAWFRWDDINEIEEAAMPDFFTGKYPSRTPEVYMAYRNSIIQLYRKQPSRKISSTDARRHVVGDVDSIQGVWEFLDKWGLINFQALDPASLAYAHVVAGTAVQAPSLAGPGAAEQPQAVAPFGMLLNLKPVTHTEALQAATTGGNTQNQITSSHRRNQANAHKALAEAAAAASRTSGQPPRIMCSAMPWVECTYHRYHCLKYPSIDLCPAAFADGRFPPGCTAKDFVKIDRKTLADATDDNGWAPCETLLLLEALELFGERWDKVTEHVGTKTQVQCLMHFLALPIEDAALDELEQGWGSTTAAARQQQIPGSIGITGELVTAPPNAGVEPIDKFRPPGPVLPPPHAPAIALPAPPLPLGAEGMDATGQGTADGRGASGGRAQEGEVPGLQGEVPAAETMEAAVAAQLVPCFSESSNPIMAQAAVLSVLLGPKLAAEYAATAIAELSHHMLPDLSPEGEPMDVDGQSVLQASLSGPALQRAVHAAHTAGVVAVAARARVMAEQEEREMYRLVNQLIGLQAQKVEIKLKHLADLDQALETEAASLEGQRDACMAERRQLRERRRQAPAINPLAPLSGGASSIPGGPPEGTGQGPANPMQHPMGMAGVPGLLPGAQMQMQPAMPNHGGNTMAMQPMSLAGMNVTQALQAIANQQGGSQGGGNMLLSGAQGGLPGLMMGQGQPAPSAAPGQGTDPNMVIDLT